MKKRRLLGFLLSLALMMTMMPALAFAEDAPDADNAESREVALEHDSIVENAEAQDAAAEEEPSVENAKAQDMTSKDVSVQTGGDPHLWIGSIPVTESGPVKGEGITGGVNVVFDDNGDAALRLSNATIRGEKEYGNAPNSYYANIHSEGINLTIELTGTNNIESKSESGDVPDPADYAIYVEKKDSKGGSLSFKGSGSLAVNGNMCAVYTDNNCEIKNGRITATAFAGCAINADNDCTISGGEISATSEHDIGINGENNVVISGGRVSATSGTECGICGRENVTISGGVVNARVEHAYHSSYYNYCAAISSYGALTIDGDDTVVIADITGDSKEKYVNGLSAIFAYGDVNISGGMVNANVSEAGAESDAIYSDNNITISDAKVTAIASEVGKESDAIYSYNMTINDAKVIASINEAGIKSDAIYSYNNMTINDAKVTASVSNVGILCNALGAGSMNINDAKVTASVNNAGNESDAIYSNKNMTINDAKVTAINDNGRGIRAASLSIESTEGGKRNTCVDAKAESNGQENVYFAIATGKNSLKIGDGLAITTPKGGTIGNTGEGSATIMDGDKYATHAVIQPAAYKIDVADTTGGKAKTEPVKAGEGEVVKVVTTPDEGNEVDKIIIIDEDGIEADITEKSAFTMGRSNVTVKVTFRKKIGPTITTIAKTSAKTTTVKWSWDKATDATSYKLAYRKVGSNEWKVKNTKKTKYVIKRQKLKGLYEYKVAAVTSDGDVWSDVSCRYFKGVQARARVSKGAIKVKWKKDKVATSYEILIAKNKKMNGAQVIQVASTAKSYKVTGLEKGKYYVKVRPVKEYNGVTYTGVLCKARKVRIK
ncbi:MAG: hypothetical protein E7219_03275 [Clostridiales bacterium]|nr:hypothetical protein [Clostridiales bacterium]